MCNMIHFYLYLLSKYIIKIKVGMFIEIRNNPMIRIVNIIN